MLASVRFFKSSIVVFLLTIIISISPIVNDLREVLPVEIFEHRKFLDGENYGHHIEFQIDLRIAKKTFDNLFNLHSQILVLNF